MSFQMASSKALSERSRVPTDWGAMTHWSCEKDPSCQRVLANTWPGLCCFGDVKDVRVSNAKHNVTAHCTTHGIECPIKIGKKSGRH